MANFTKYPATQGSLLIYLPMLYNIKMYWADPKPITICSAVPV